MNEIDIIKVITPATIAFITGIALTPVLTHYLYKYKAWKKKSVALATDGAQAPISQSLHSDEVRQTPRMGGIVVWGSVLIATIIFWILGESTYGALFNKIKLLES